MHENCGGLFLEEIRYLTIKTLFHLIYLKKATFNGVYFCESCYPDATFYFGKLLIDSNVIFMFNVKKKRKNCIKMEKQVKVKVNKGVKVIS